MGIAGMNAEFLKAGMGVSVVCACALFLACGDDDSWSPANQNPEMSSSSKVTSSSSEDKSSSSEVEDSRSGTFFHWKGGASDYWVNTGLDNGTETSGYWYFFDDHAEGGLSTITWPAKIDVGFLDELDPVIDACDGVCGKFELDVGSLDYHPFVGVAFNVAGVKSLSRDPFADPDVADASAWGGLCISYTNDVEATLELSTGEPLYGYDLPYVTLPRSETGDEVCFAWSRFRRAGWGEWGTKGKETGDEAAKSLATVIIMIQKAGGTGKFNIMSIGSYN